MITGVISLFFVIPLTTYYLDPRDFGIVAIIMVFSRLVVPLSSIGFSWVLPGHFYTISEEEKTHLLFTLLVTGSVLRAFWIILFGVLGYWVLPFAIKSYQPVFLFYFWIFLVAEWFNFFWEIVSFLITLEKKASSHAVLDITKLISRLAALIVALVFIKLKVAALAYAYLAAGIGGFLFSIIYVSKYLKAGFKVKWLKETVKRGFPTILIQLFEMFSESITRFFIERWIGLSSLGIYSHSLDYRKAFMMPHRAFQQTYSPEVLQVCSQKTSVLKVKSALKKWFGLLALAGMFVILFGKSVILILTHGKFVEASLLVSLWFVLIVIYALGISYNQFVLANKKTNFIFWSEIIVGIISWGIIAFCVKFFGIIGAAVSILVYFFLFYLTRKIYSHKLGCPDFEGPYFIATLLLLCGLIFVNNTFVLSLPAKCLYLAIGTIFTVCFYGLISFKNLKEKFISPRF